MVKLWSYAFIIPVTVLCPVMELNDDIYGLIGYSRQCEHLGINILSALTIPEGMVKKSPFKKGGTIAC